MFLNLDKIIKVHFYKDISIITDQKGFEYYLDEGETYLLKKVLSNSDIDTTLNTMSRELNVGISKATEFLDIFRTNFSKYITTDPCKKDNPKTTGIEGECYPSELSISLTNFCKHLCVHCLKGNISTIQHLNFKSLTNFLDSLIDKVSVIWLTGGEPLLYPNITQLLQRYYKHFDFYISTSAYGIEDTVIKEMYSMCKGFQISIYSSYSYIHDDFTGKKGSYDEIINFVDTYNHIPMTISTLLNDGNKEDIINLINIMRRRKIYNFNIGKIMNIGRAQKLHIDNNNFDTNLEDIKSHFPDLNINEIKSEIPKTKFPISCGAGTIFKSIDEFGNVKPCLLSDIIIGNISDTKIFVNDEKFLKKSDSLICNCN